jgi:GT2 family glycosyltransferase
MPRVTVVIPNWNGLDHLPECMAALARQTYGDFGVVVVDNGSSDGSLAWLRENAPETRIIARADNGGFAVAVNEGIRSADGDYVALLNNDTLVDDRWLAELVATLDRTGYDLAASLMVFYDEPEVVNAAGDDYYYERFAMRNRGITKPASEYLEPVRVLGACAGAAIYRRRLFDEIGFFDERFFLNHEDSDLNLRALIAGKRCAYVPTAVVRHKHSATVKSQPSWKMRRYVIRNQAAVVTKDLPWSLIPRALASRPYHWWRFTRPWTLRALPKKPRVFFRLGRRLIAEFEGYFMGLAGRRDVWRRQAVPTAEVVKWLRDGVGPLE